VLAEKRHRTVQQKSGVEALSVNERKEGLINTPVKKEDKGDKK